jgi:hypothetical protein
MLSVGREICVTRKQIRINTHSRARWATSSALEYSGFISRSGEGAALCTQTEAPYKGGTYENITRARLHGKRKLVKREHNLNRCRRVASMPSGSLSPRYGIK